MSRTPTNRDLTRRHLLGRSAAVLAGLAAGGGVISVARSARGAAREVTFQLGWIISNGQIGEIVARSLGYFEAEQINLKIAPGGPNVDGVNIVASGSAQAGNLSSSPSLMLARAGGIPIKCFAVGYQEHPFTYFSLPKNPIRTPKDMVGKKIGTQGTARQAQDQRVRRQGADHGQRHDAAAHRAGRRGHRLAHQCERAPAARARA